MSMILIRVLSFARAASGFKVERRSRSTFIELPGASMPVLLLENANNLSRCKV